MATHEKLDTAQEWFNRALLFRNTGELHKAADACRCAIKLSPNEPTAIHFLNSLEKEKLALRL